MIVYTTYGLKIRIHKVAEREIFTSCTDLFSDQFHGWYFDVFLGVVCPGAPEDEASA